MKIIVNNANMVFVKGVTNMLASVNWVKDGYWSKNPGSNQSVMTNSSYFRNEELIPVGNYKKFSIKWTSKDENSTIFVAFNSSDNKVISTETIHGGTIELDIPDNTTTLCVFGIVGSLPLELRDSLSEAITGVFE